MNYVFGAIGLFHLAMYFFGVGICHGMELFGHIPCDKIMIGTREVHPAIYHKKVLHMRRYAGGIAVLCAIGYYFA